MKKAICIISLLALTACKSGYGMTPLPLQTEVEGPPEYKIGWKDGCQSGLATYGSFVNKLQYDYYQNYSMLDSPHYVAAWHEGFDYCRHFNLKWYTQES